MRTSIRRQIRATVATAVLATTVLAGTASSAGAAATVRQPSTVDQGGSVYQTYTPGPVVGGSALSSAVNFIGLDGVESWPNNNLADVNCVVGRDASRGITVRPPGFQSGRYFKTDIYTLLWKWNGTAKTWQAYQTKVQQAQSWLWNAGLHEEAFTNLPTGSYAVSFQVVWQSPIANPGGTITSWTPTGTKLFPAFGYELSTPHKRLTDERMDAFFASILFDSVSLPTPWCTL